MDKIVWVNTLDVLNEEVISSLRHITEGLLERSSDVDDTDGFPVSILHENGKVEEPVMVFSFINQSFKSKIPFLLLLDILDTY